MKNILTLKKFCLVVAIVGLLHTIVDAEAVALDGVRIYNKGINSGSVLFDDRLKPNPNMDAIEFMKTAKNKENVTKLFDSVLLPGHGYSTEPIVSIYNNLAEMNHTPLVNEILEKHGYVLMAYYFPVEVGPDILIVRLTVKLNNGKYGSILNCQFKKNSTK